MSATLLSKQSQWGWASQDLCPEWTTAEWSSLKFLTKMGIAESRISVQIDPQGTSTNKEGVEDWKKNLFVREVVN